LLETFVARNRVNEVTQPTTRHPFFFGKVSDPPEQVTLSHDGTKVNLVRALKIQRACAALLINDDLALVVAFNQPSD
jgi:hypothetical protein